MYSRSPTADAVGGYQHHHIMPLLAHPRLTAWAARLIHSPASSLAWHQRLLRRRLLLGTQMTDVEADMYDRGLWFFGIVSVGLVPMGLLMAVAMFIGLAEQQVFTADDYFYGCLVGPLMLIAGIVPIVFIATPLIGRHAAQHFHIPPQPYQTWTEQVVQHSIFRVYLQYLVKHKRWNPLYRLCCHVARAGAGYYKMEGHTHRDTPIFWTYSYSRVAAPAMYFALLFAIIGFYILFTTTDELSAGDYVLPTAFGTMGLLTPHFFIGKMHGDVFETQDVVTPGVMTREMALKGAIYSGIGGAIVINSHHIKAWVLSWW